MKKLFKGLTLKKHQLNLLIQTLPLATSYHPSKGYSKNLMSVSNLAPCSQLLKITSTPYSQ